MQIEIFKVFTDLVETGSFGRAAARNAITQSAVSQQIRSLERTFKATLIERRKKNFSLTQEGEAFLEASREILRVYGGLTERIRRLTDRVAGTLRVAAVYSVGLHDLPPYLKRFREVHPSVDVRVGYHRSADVYAAVLEGTVDLGLVAFPARRKGLAIEPLWRDRLVLICPPGHRLASRDRVRLPSLRGESFIAFAPDLPTAKAVARHMRDAGVDVRKTMEFDSIETVKRAVEIGSGVSIVPHTTVREETRAGTLVAVEIEEPGMDRPIAALTKRNRTIAPAQRHFIRFLQDDTSAGK